MVAWNKADGRVAIVAGARTPFTKMGGPLRDVHVSDLAKVAMQETLYRAHWPSERLDEVLLGQGLKLRARREAETALRLNPSDRAARAVLDATAQ